MEIRAGEWQGGRRALLACKLKCCHLNANKTPSRARAGDQKERGRGGRSCGARRMDVRKGGRGERLTDRADRGAYVVERKFRKESFFHPRCSYAPLEIWRSQRSSSTRRFSKPTLSCVRDQLERVLRTRHYELWDTQADFHGFSRREGRGGGRDIVSAACCVAAERRFQVTGSGARFYAACGAGNCGENAFPLLL